MNIYEIQCIPKKEKKFDKASLIGWLAALYRDGQITENYLIFRKKGCYTAVVSGYHKNFVERNCDIQESFKKLSMCCHIKIKKKGKDVDSIQKMCKCNPSPYYIMKCDNQFTRDDSPFLCGKCHRAVPLYRFPYIKDQEHYVIRCFDSAYRGIEDAWYHCQGEKMETEAEQQMADIASDLNVEGRNICNQLEKKMQIPFYYCLFSYEQAHEKCPGCGKKFREEEEASFCDGCRIVIAK
ncbi:MAG: DUF2310 family Zn-ribbon-containing protein [Lachnospiraceae bacterium]|nr:DUF2310 family Zn-ribbon-containing protein [Lachnospiraceae bacterium]